VDGSHLSPWTDRLSLQGFDRRVLDDSMLATAAARHMQLGLGQLTASIERLRFNRLAMRVTEFSAAVRATVEPPDDVVTLGFVLRADEPFLIAGRRFRTGMMGVFAAGQVSEVRYPSGSRSVTLAVPSTFFEGQLANASMRNTLGKADAVPQVQVSSLDAARLHDVVSAIEALAAADAGLWLDGQWIANAERALLEAFLRPLGNPVSIDLGSCDRLCDAGTIVREVEARLDADPTSIPSISALCASLGISRRSLERAFHDLLGVSPAHHLRLRSLNAVRESLLRCRPEPGIITRTALDNGFWHLGRFSLSYRALFGERPIDTLRRGSPSDRSPRARGPHSAGEPLQA